MRTLGFLVPYCNFVLHEITGSFIFVIQFSPSLALTLHQMRSLLLLPILFLVSCASSPTSTNPPHRFVNETISEVNRFRVRNGLSALTPHQGLNQIAAKHSENMLAAGKMDHADFSSRAKFAQKKYHFGALSENVHNAWGRIPSPSHIVQRWIDSPKHRKNMLSPRHSVGVGFAEENQKIYSTLILGSPRL